MIRKFAALVACIATFFVLTGCSVRAGNEPATTKVDPPAKVVIKGALSYRQRIALPPDSLAIVELREASGAGGLVVKEQRIDLKGKQVPIPFELAVDPAKLVSDKQYNVRGGIVSGGKPVWASEPVRVEARSGVVDVGTLDMTPIKVMAFATVFDCGGRSVSVGAGERSMQLSVGDETFDMRPVTSASGAKYEAVGDPSTTFWNKGDVSTLVVRGQTYPECKKAGNETKAFRATGNEPGWRLDIDREQMTLLTNNGSTRIATPTPAAEKTAAATKYAAVANGKPLTVTIFDRPCSDTMSGMPHPKTVVVVHEGRELKGCGGDPATLLQGAEWIVEDIDGTGIVERSRVTLSFQPNGRVSGNASCNGFGGEYSLTGEGLTFSKTFTTMKACEQSLMTQERLFLDVLQGVQRFEMSPDGALILYSGDGRKITARRS